ncbi:DUF6880 family protein [uncultured Nitrospira sp.]|uniref:DUF6880 family protein n=1 Tax=uncultured Nitrospira sp. TaxID=157176 RepID=UPI003140292B
MSDHRKQRLRDLGADALAEALLKLANRDESAEVMVERLITTPKEALKHVKSKLSGLKRSRKFISWRESAHFARELEDVLQDIKAGVDDSRTGAELMASFFETDGGTLGRCDDSSGHIGDVYRLEAKDLFVEYAARCDDKKWLGELVLTLNRKDDYGVRDTLIDCAAAYLPESQIRNMIARLNTLAEAETEEYQKRHWLLGIESLARQIKDPALFEKTRIAAWGKPSTSACADIARVYLESGDAETALLWLERVPAQETFQIDERDQLLLQIYDLLGNREKQANVAWRIFRRLRCSDSLHALLAVIGQEKGEGIMRDEIQTIVSQKTLVLSDAAFLLEIGCFEEGERYLLDRADQLNGDFYGSLVPLAEILETKGRALGATILYRALLDSILRRARTKTYPHGVRYLKKLDKLAPSISDWRNFHDHSIYSEHLQEKHRRKTSFWSRYRA